MPRGITDRIAVAPHAVRVKARVGRDLAWTDTALKESPMDALEVFERLAENYQIDADSWPESAERASAESGNDPRVAALVAYLGGLSADDRGNALSQGAGHDQLRDYLRDGGFGEATGESTVEASGEQESGSDPAASAAEQGDHPLAEFSPEEVAWLIELGVFTVTINGAAS
jgi:hypothetical protein